MAKEGVTLAPGAPSPRPSASAPDARRVLLVGFGHVGRALALSLARAGHGRPGFPWRVVAVVDSRGAVHQESGLDLAALVAAKEKSGQLQGTSYRATSALSVIAEVRPEVVVEVSVADPTTGEPGTTHILRALSQGADVVTSNKGPFALRYREVQAAVSRSGRRIRYGTTVGGIVPILETLVERLPAAGVEEVQAVLNGTTQFVLARLSEGDSLEAATDLAREQGLTEPDPSWDLGGHDAALKAAILHNALFAPPISAADVPREGIDAGVEAVARQARTQGRCVVLKATVRRGHAEVHLSEVPIASPFAAPGPINVFEVTTRHAGRLLLQGPGAGAEVTAAGLAADLASLETSAASPGARWEPVVPVVRSDPWIGRASWPPTPPVEPSIATASVVRRRTRAEPPVATARLGEGVRAW